MILDRYRPLPAWYSVDPHDIHGLAHAARVLVWADQVGQWMIDNGAEVDLEVVRWAAAVHDVGRLDNGRDPEHGARSAAWWLGHPEIGADLTPAQRRAVAWVCERHVPNDDTTPAFSPELACFKDADGLDRVRIRDLNPDRLRTSRARDLLHEAERLFALTEADSPDPWQAVRTVALGWRLWR